MIKPEGYEQVTEAGEVRKLPAGIYGLIITDATDVPDRQYLNINLDIAKGEFKDYFKVIGCNYIRSYKTNALPFFKAFITAVEKSNSNYKWDWNEKSLIGKNVVGVFGEEEYVANDGSVKVRVVLKDVRSLQAFKEGTLKVPELKKLSPEEIEERMKQLQPISSEILQPVEEVKTESVITDDDLPF